MSATTASEALDDLIHDVNCKCSSIKNAADLLRKASESEKRDLLKLMAQEARNLAQCLGDAERKQASG